MRERKLIIGGERRRYQAHQTKSNEQAAHDGFLAPQTSLIEGGNS